MSAVNQYLENNLHSKPISSHLMRGVLWTTTSIQKRADETVWQGRTLIVISKAVLIAGAIVTIPIAAIEAVSLYIFAGLGMGLNYYFYSNHSAFLQHWSLKGLSYGFHSTLNGVALLTLGFKTPNLRYHTTNAIFDHALHLLSAALSQGVVGALLEGFGGYQINLAPTRVVNLLSDSHPALLNDILAQLQRDVGINLNVSLRNLPQLQQYLQRYPEVQAFVQSINVQNLISDAAYRTRALTIVRDFLVEMGLIERQPLGASPWLFELHQNTPEESRYQEYLASTLKGSFLEIYRNDRLVNMLGNQDHSGKQLMEVFDASIYVPLTMYTQYNELVQALQCPRHFQGNLSIYGGRSFALGNAKGLLERLTADQKQLLVEKILRGGDFVVEQAVKDVYIAIGNLAPALYQGPLMTKQAINLIEVANGNVIETRNLFQKACQEALAEI